MNHCSERWQIKSNGLSSVIILSLCLLWSLLSTFPSIAFAASKIPKSKFALEVKNKHINLFSQDSNSLDILRELEKKAGVKIIILKGVPNQKISLNIKNLSVYAVSDLFDQMGLKNFAVVYENNTHLLQ